MRNVARETQISELRKQELILATLNSICKHGYLNSTINTISEESGLSRGLINHYFASKEDLLTAAHRYYLQNADDFHRHIASSCAPHNFRWLLYAACGPFIRRMGYDAIIIHYMSAAWVVPEIRALHKELWGKYRSHLGRRLQAVAQEKGITIDVRLAAITLSQLSDGLWLGKVMEEGAYSNEDCIVIIRKWLCDLFGENPDDYPLVPDFDLTDFPTSAPLPKRDTV